MKKQFKKTRVLSDPSVKEKFKQYPASVKPLMMSLRQLIVDTANELKLEELHESLKWNEPSYKSKNGSPIRMDWKEKSPNQYALYFQCTSQLVPTFKALFGDNLTYEKTRAIIFNTEQQVPIKTIKKCIGLALNYHKLKSLPLLGE